MGIDDLIFNKSNRNSTEAINPIEIFNYLDKKDGFGYLRTNQAEFLKEWNNRRTDRDIVGIMHTGAGKTLVGLLMLQSKLVEEKKPAIYLCPTVQLVEQTIKQARNYGISTCQIESNNHIPVEFKNSEKILITTFSKLFNGRSIFGVKEFTNSANLVEVGSILIDDAHSCVDYARQSSTISISNEKVAYEQIFELFKVEIERQSYGKYNAICNSEDSVSVQIPYWEWISNIEQVKKILREHFSGEEKDFAYRMIQSILQYSRCYISGKKLEVVPKYNPIEQIPSFFNAKHRYILSATINEKDLREELGIEKEAVENPIVTQSYVADVGERMILSPSKYHKKLTDSYIRKWIFEACKKNNMGLVVIVPSNYSSTTKEWRNLGANIIDNTNYEKTLENIENGIREQVVLVNRYEGVDFPSDQAHMLILDGLPEFTTNKDKAISTTSQDDNWKLKIVQKIEQGMGRTVRSNSDYSVVLLLGDKLVDFVSLKSNLKYFSLATQVQLSISNSIVSGTSFETVDQACEEISKSINYCIQRNKDWVSYAKNELSKVNVEGMNYKDISDIEDEYYSYQKYTRDEFEDSISILEKIRQRKGAEDLGRMYQEEAEVRFFNGDIQNSQNLQKLAYENWDYALKPKVSGYQKIIKNSELVTSSFDYIKNFEDKHSLNKFIDDIINNLKYDNDSSSDLFEESIEQLGKLIGLHSIRPENIKDDGGPDNLWISQDFRFVIECKNRETKKISKDDVEQLLHSELWFKNNYGIHTGNKLVLFHADRQKESNVQFPNNIYIVYREKLFKLKDNIEQFKQLLYANFDSLTKEQLNDFFNRSQLNIRHIEQNIFVKPR